MTPPTPDRTALGCEVSSFSPRVCERGTKGCDTHHTERLSDERLAEISASMDVEWGSPYRKALASELLAEVERLHEELSATTDDVLVLLDHHVSDEVRTEARLRLVERLSERPL